jgi:RNA polymerase sigma-70 factor (ECF subfamily)
VWAEFVRRFHPVISTVALRTARNWGGPATALLDDLVQETYLKLCADDCRLLRNFRSHHPGSFFGFLKIVTANVVHDHFKASRAAKRGGGGVPESLEGQEGNYERGKPPAGFAGFKIEQNILLQEIDQCLKKGVAPAEVCRCRRIFWLYYRCGLSARAIASLPEIDLTTKGVESVILRLNRLVRTAIARSSEANSRADDDSHVGEKGVRRAGSL